MHTEMKITENLNIAVLGLGYVGLPLAVEFGKIHKVVGYDTDINRITELCSGLDRTREINAEELASARHLILSSEPETINNSNVYVITVPTPVDEAKVPDFTPLKHASALIADKLEEGNVVIYESTVYPGATEEICVPILEAGSGLKYNKDFFVGYSPERVNPGDKDRTVTKIKKVTSGSTKECATFVDKLYNQIIEAGTHIAPSIKVAEAAKVIENTQRDVNIALVNELSIIFSKMKLDTFEVLEAARTKWNFLDFRPGLVGGHCIGVDPYYLTQKAQSIGYHPEIILAGRRINDSMSKDVSTRFIKALIQSNSISENNRVLLLGVTFKENCPDIRNSKVFDLKNELNSFGLEVDLYDPKAETDQVKREYGETLLSKVKFKDYAGIILAVPHNELIQEGLFSRSFLSKNGVLFDLKSIYTKELSDLRL